MSGSKVPAPEDIEFAATDGYLLRGRLWRPERDDGSRPAVIVCCATGVAARYYGRFAAWLSAHGLPAMTFDYRGIGDSRYGSLRGLRATKHDWGALDTDAAIRTLATRFPGRTLVGVGHSIGGFCLGSAPSNVRLARLLLVGSQYAYWPDYAPRQRVGYLLRWHLLMPALALLMGYFPGKRLGWLEDLPRASRSNGGCGCGRISTGCTAGCPAPAAPRTATRRAPPLPAITAKCWPAPRPTTPTRRRRRWNGCSAGSPRRARARCSSCRLASA